MLAKMKKRKKTLIVGVLAIIAVVIALVILIPGGNNAAAGANPDISSYQVHTSNITNTVEGTGNLAHEDAEDISIPTGIIIDEVLVESGDYVSEGDILMIADTASITAKIAEIQESITTLDEEIDDVKDDTESTKIKAGVSGRVKKIYAGEGESVTSRMSESGSLMLLSVDGLMAVNISSSSLNIGDSVTVTLSDGTTKDGTVENVSGDVCTITLTDNGPELGDEVTVTDSDGNEVGTGTLYIHSEIAVIGTSGKVDSVSVSENQSVSSSTTLLKLTDVAASSEYLSLMNQRADLVESLQELVTLSQTGAITATFSGMVTAVNFSAGDTISSSTSSASDDSDSSSDSSNGTGGYGLSSQSSNRAAMTLLSNTTFETLEETPSDNPNEDQTKEISSVNISITAPAAGSVAQTEITGSDLPYTGKITWSPTLESGNSFGYGKAYNATVTLTAKEGYKFAGNTTVNLSSSTAENINSGDRSTLVFTASYAATDSASPTPSNNAASGGMGSNSSSYGGSYPSSSSYSGNSSTASNNNSSSSSADTNTVTIDEIAVISIAPDENLIINIGVDELDIMSLAVDQTAIITLDAVENEIFAGTITKINTTATSSGGVTTYSATVSVPKTDSMLAGMSASVSIVIEEESGVLIIPVDAVQEVMGSAFVYTEKGEDGELSGQVEIETGISDGMFVQVVSGLSEGDTVYYIIIKSDDAAAIAGGNFSFGMAGGMGGRVVDRSSMPEFDRSAMPAGGNPPNGN